MVIQAAVAAAQSRGQSIWLDDLSRELLDSGELASLVDEGITGITTNPAIFERAISTSPAYDVAIDRARAQGEREALKIYEALVLDDVRRAVQLLHPVFERRRGADGFVSLEVPPALAYDAQATFEDALRLWTQIARPNLMIKVPATGPGLAAIPRLVAAGVNINATLIFSTDTYRRVQEAYMDGLEARLSSGLGISSAAGVASFFVSRIDARVDDLLAKRGSAEEAMQGERASTALMLAHQVYDGHRRVLASARWHRLAQHGARPQRPLWASMASKHPADPPTRYVGPLVLPGTVSTLPLETYRTFRAQALPGRAMEPDVGRARAQVASLARAGIDLDAVAEDLLADGVDRFVQAFDRLLRAVQAKVDAPRPVTA